MNSYPEYCIIYLSGWSLEHFPNLSEVDWTVSGARLTVSTRPERRLNRKITNWASRRKLIIQGCSTCVSHPLRRCYQLLIISVLYDSKSVELLTNQYQCLSRLSSLRLFSWLHRERPVWIDAAALPTSGSRSKWCNFCLSRSKLLFTSTFESDI